MHESCARLVAQDSTGHCSGWHLGGLHLAGYGGHGAGQADPTGWASALCLALVGSGHQARQVV